MYCNDFLKAIVLLFAFVMDSKATPSSFDIYPPVNDSDRSVNDDNFSSSRSQGSLQFESEADGGEQDVSVLNKENTLADEERMRVLPSALNVVTPSEEELTAGEELWALDIKSNPKLLPAYISTDIEQSARLNVQLREYFQNCSATFEKLFKAVKKHEEDLAAAKKKLKEVYSAAEKNISLVNTEMRTEFLTQRAAYHSSLRRFQRVEKTEDENESEMLHGLGKIQNQLTTTKMNGNELMDKITNLMQTVSSIASFSPFNPIQGPMDAANILPLIMS